jgi:hypothetical protein
MNGNPSARVGGIALAVTLTSVIWCGPSQATTCGSGTSFGFCDEYFVSTLAEFHTRFGSTTTGYNTPGIYQETNTTTPTVVQLTAQSTGYQPVPGEFVQNTTPNASTGLLLHGWSFNFFSNGQQLSNGANSVSNGPNNNFNPGTSGTGLNFQYLTGDMSGSLSNGTVTAFNINSIVVDSTNTAVSFKIEGLVGGPGGTVVDTANESLNFALSQQTVNLNWTGVDTVAITDFGGPAGTLLLQNVNLTPVPAPAPLIGHGLLAVLAIGGVLFGSNLLERSKRRRSLGIVTPHGAA